MMKKLVVATGVACGLALATSANAADKVTIQLKWVTQAQFAGYYVAKAKGFYKDAGLDVTINPGGPDIAPPQVIAGGGADVVVDWMPSALASREKGVPLVNISQTFKKSGLELTCRADTGIKTPADFKGKTHRRVVRRQRISVPVLDVEARHQDRRLARRRQGAQAGLQRRSAAAEAGRLHLDHDLQRILAGDRRRLQAEPARRLQIRGRRRGDAGGRPLCHGSQAQGPGVRRQDGEVREGLDEGLGLRQEPRQKPPRSCSPPTPPARRPRSTRSG